MAVDKRNVQASTGKANQALNEDELENYGVWVKSEPRDISSFTTKGEQSGLALDSSGLDSSGLEMSGLEMSGLEDSGEAEDVKDETFLSLEEETLLDSFGDEPSPSADFSVDDIKKPLKGGNAEEIEDPLEISLDAFESEDFPKPEALEIGPEIETIDLHEPLSGPETESPEEELQDEFSIPDFNISESEAVESAPFGASSTAGEGEDEDAFDALQEAEEIDLGDIPSIEEETEEIEPVERHTGSFGSAPGEEEISLEDFGMESESAPSPKKIPEKAPSSETSEVSLDDFVDIESFGINPDDSGSKDGDDELEPIEMNLDFDDSIESEPLSMVRDHDAAAPSFDETLKEEPVPAYTGPAIDTEEVTDFDEFINADTTPQIVRQDGKTEKNDAIHALDVTGDFMDTGLEESSVEESAGLISEAESVDLAMGSLESVDDPAPASVFHAENADTLANIDNLTEDIPLDAIQAAATEDLSDFEFADEEISTAVESQGEDDFDEIQALERSLTEGEGTVRGKEDQDNESQASILHKIANELSTIKEELASLKEELSSMRSGAKGVPTAEDQLDKKAKGFFDEEEDETIALTGDELDNILNTADFTEETGAPETHEGEIPAETEGARSVAELDDLIPLEPASKASAAKISLGEERKPSAPGARDDQGLSELNKIHDAGISPMTEAPEDTSYLEEPIDEELESLTLPETPLEEPDLSDFIVADETEIVSPHDGFGIAEEPAEEPAEEELLEDITLDLDSDLGSDTLADNVVELDNVAELDNVDELVSVAEDAAETDDFLSEISLAEEGLPEMEEVEELDTVPLAQEPELPLRGPKAEKASPIQADQEARAELPRMEPPKAPSTPKELSPDLKKDIKSVLQYMDRLLESLPEDKIEEFAHSEHFSVYKKLFEELGLL
jgi:pilus assembly protein FimV